MDSHVRSCSNELWDVVVYEFKPINPDHMTLREFYDRQPNATSWEKIRSAHHRDLHNQVSELESTKEIWDI
jgi:hypothetical protein